MEEREREREWTNRFISIGIREPSLIPGCGTYMKWLKIIYFHMKTKLFDLSSE